MAIDIDVLDVSHPAVSDSHIDEAEAGVLLRGVDAEAHRGWLLARPLLEADQLAPVTAVPAGVPATRRRRQGLRLVVLGAAIAFATLRLSGGPAVFVNGHRTSLPSAAETVIDVLRGAGVEPHDGVLRAAASHRVLNARAQPAVVLLDGVPSSPSTLMRSGEHVRVTDGVDRTEPVVTRRVRVVATGLPPIERNLWHTGRSGIDETVVGSVSGEIMRRAVVRPAGAASPQTAKVVALTFDDGPDPRWTPAVLAVLRRNHIRATFCLIGLWVDKYPDLVRQELAEGHTLCDHTVHHPLHLDHLPHPQVVAEIDDAADAIRRQTGQDPAFFRPPGGNVSDDAVDVAHQRGMRVLGWSVDPHDYEKVTPPLVLARIMAEVKPGAVILMHDGGGDRSATVTGLQTLIDSLRAAGYSFATP